MSPEQARGKPADKRTDIWAFGCVLFEMLSGRRTVTDEETVSDTVAAILKSEPPWEALPRDTPPRIRTLLQRCLRKDVRRRLPDIAEARIQIEEAASEPTEPPQPSPVASSRRNVWPAIAAFALAVGTGLGITLVRAPAPDVVTVRVDISAPPGATQLFADGRTLEVGDPISPDGRTVAFLASSEGRRMIWVRPMDSVAARALLGTENASRPVWSPDSGSLAFIAQNQLHRVALAGGHPTVIAKVDARDIAWGPGDVILVGGANKPIRRLSAQGGEAMPVTQLQANESTHDYPEFLPDGRHFLYLARHGDNVDDWDVYIGSLDSSARRRLDGIHAGVRYSPSGHLLYVSDQTLMARPFDTGALQLTGEAFAVAEDVTRGPRPAFSVASNGSLAYLNAVRSFPRQLAWFDRGGKQLAAVGPRETYERVRLSADDRMLAFDRNLDIFLFDIERGSTSRFVSGPAADLAPVWSSVGRTIAFASSREPAGNQAQTNVAAAQLYQRSVGSTGEDEVLLKTNAGKIPSDWSQAGYLVYTSGDDIHALRVPVSEKAEVIRVTATPSFSESDARFSPDGRWIAYQSNESGRIDVWVQSFPDGGVKQQVSTNGGWSPRWAPNGRELFYVAPDLTLMSVPITSSANTLTAGTPAPLFQSRVFEGAADYNVSRDGRFLVNIPSPEQTPPPIVVIHNWGASLKNQRAR